MTYLEEIGGHDHQVEEQKDAFLGLALPVLFQQLDIGALQHKVEASQQLSLLVRHRRQLGDQVVVVNRGQNEREVNRRNALSCQIGLISCVVIVFVNRIA